MDKPKNTLTVTMQVNLGPRNMLIDQETLDEEFQGSWLLYFREWIKMDGFCELFDFMNDVEITEIVSID